MDQPSERDDAAGDLLSTLEVIEAQPLATRADAYEALHDTLARRLDTTPGTAASSGATASPGTAAGSAS